MSDAHEAWVDRCTRWERIHAEQQVEIAELKRRLIYAETECDDEHDIAQELAREVLELQDELVERDTQIAALKAALVALNDADMKYAQWVANALGAAGWQTYNLDRNPHHVARMRASMAAAAAVGIPEEPRDG